jgi:hypothetical protein
VLENVDKQVIPTPPKAGAVKAVVEVICPAFHVPIPIVPSVVILAEPAHVDKAVFSTFPNPTAALVNDNDSVGVVVEFNTVDVMPVLSVKANDVTVPVPNDGVKYSKAVAPAFTLNSWLAVPKEPNPVPPRDGASCPVQPTAIDVAFKSAVNGVPPSKSVTLVSSVLLSACPVRFIVVVGIPIEY